MAGVRRSIPKNCPVSPMKRKISALALPLAMFALLAGCSKITQENYDKLQTGMSYEQVQAVLGAPKSCSDVLGVKSCTWGDAKHHIDVSFLGDKALAYSAEGLR